jgi:GNAT superfamily N-acetyltransferase
VSDSPDIALVELHLEDVAEVQRVMEWCEDYFAETHGRVAAPTEAESLFAHRPPGASSEAKHVWGALGGDGRLVAVADVIEGWPDPETWMLGLLLVEPGERDRGLGGAIVEELADRAVAVRVHRLRAGAFRNRPAAVRFWRAHGFAEEGVVLRDEGVGERELVVLVRELEQGGTPSGTREATE